MPFGRREDPIAQTQLDGLNTFLSGGGAYEKKQPPTDEAEEEDIDFLIDELESVGDMHDIEELSDDSQSISAVPDELLGTNPICGLTDGEVVVRRKRYGLNKMKEEKENHFIKFLSFFVGPIQFVMEV